MSTMGVFSTIGGIVMHVGEYHEYRGGVQCHGGYHEYCGGYHDACGGYHEYRRVFSTVGDIMSTGGIS